jgi:solute:Na+ symporter, SSS family
VFVEQIAALATDMVTAVSVGGPVLCSLVVFVVVGWLRPWTDPESDALVDALGEDGPELVDVAAADKQPQHA